MGKPRRCSAAFLEEERETLKRKREKIREIYLNSNIDNLNDYQDLPESISLPLIIGSRCTVLYRKTHDGLFDGTINAIDLKNGIYRVSFEKQNFVCENVYDFETRSLDPAESMPLVAFESKKNRPVACSNSNSNVKKLYNQQKLNEIIDDHQQSQLNCIKEENSTELSNELNSIASVNSDESFVRFMNHCSLNSNNSTNSTNSPNFANMTNSSINSTANLTAETTINSNATTINSTISPSQIGQSSDHHEKIIGNYPLKFLACIISFYKLINKKSAKLNELKSMNTQAEFYKSSAKLSNEFRNEYATIILELEKIKDNLNLNLEHLEQYCKELKLSPRHSNKNGDSPDEFVKRNLTNRRIDHNSTNLISRLIELLLILKNSESDDQSSLQVKLKSIKQTLNAKNNHCFENNVEMHFNHLQFNYNVDKITSSRLDAFHNDHL